MLPSRYVSGIPGLEPDLVYPDTWLATRPRGLGYYFITSHDSGSSWKPQFLSAWRKYERSTGGNAWEAVRRNRDWHLHHIAELRHCAELDIHGWLARGRSSDFSRFLAPCVLLDWQEHNYYTHSTLGAGETPELFRTEDPWERVVDRSAEAQALGTTAAGRAELRRKLRAFRDLYAAAYDGEPTLGEIASRVFDHFEEEITQAR